MSTRFEQLLSQNIKTLTESGAELYRKYGFSPLYNADGSRSYLRASMLAMFALSLIAHVGLKDSAKNDPGSQGGAVIIADSKNQTTGTFEAFDRVPNGSSAAGSLHNGGNNIAGQLDLAASGAGNGAAQGSGGQVSGQDESWSLFGFSGSEPEVDKATMAVRRQALSELSDGAAFLSSCGDINAGFKDCRFTFSNKVRPYYNAKIVAGPDNFTITLTARGKQLKDPCAKFVVSSRGEYMAFDSKGVIAEKCFMDTVIAERIATLNSEVKAVTSNDNAAADQSSLAAQ